MKTYSLKSNPYLVKVLDISTGHITKKDSMLLTRDDCPATAYEYEYGYFVFVDVSDPDLRKMSLKGELKAYKKYGFSENFLNIFKKANKLNCKYIQFDADGTEYSDLPVVEW